jgi:hypothetical protein
MTMFSVGARFVRAQNGRHVATVGFRRRTVGGVVASLIASFVMLVSIIGSAGTNVGADSPALSSSVGQALSVVSAALSPLSTALESIQLANSRANGSLVSGLSLFPTTPVAPTAPAPPASTGPVPVAVTSVIASQAGTLPDLVVTWVPSATETGAAVQLSDFVNGKATYITQITCGSCTTSTFRVLTVGTTYEAAIFPTNANGIGPSVMSSPVEITTTCTVGVCVGLNATSAIGPANHADAGIVDSVGQVGNVPADAAALHMSMWRSFMPIVPACCDWYDWDTALAAGAQTTVVLSDLWQEYNTYNGDKYAPTPWSDWSTYQSWVESTVSTLVASGQQINYWEVYNEPGGNNGYYSPSDYATETPADLLQQFLVAYQAIKAADPSAAIIGPSLAYWSDYPTQFQGDDHSFDMVTFLNFAVANNLQLAGISWHEELDNYGPTPEENSLYPEIIEDHVAMAHALIAARPSLGNPQIFINEYGMPEVQKIPGWDVEYLAALTESGVFSAGRGCWSPDCADPDLDGLLYSSNGSSPLPDYYERLIYAAMSGNMFATTSSADTVSALGSFNSSTGTLTALIGRGVGCSESTACSYNWTYYQRAAATSVRVTMTVPWTSGTAKIVESDISAAIPTLPSAAPTPMTSTAVIVPTGNGTGTITLLIPSFADGDAYGLTVTQSGS